MFIIDDNDYNNKLNNIYKTFINYQNKFLSEIDDKSIKTNDKINVQDATENNIPRFSPSDEVFLEIIMNNTEIKNIKGKDDNLGQDIFGFKFEDIEKDLAEKIKHGLKYFNENRLTTMIYFGDNGNERIINDFITKYGQKEINDKQKENIKNFIEKNKDNYDNKITKNFCSAIQSLMSFLLTNSEAYKKDKNLVEIIACLQEIKSFDETQRQLLERFFFEENDDDLALMNGENGDIYCIDTLYPIYQEFKKLDSN